MVVVCCVCVFACKLISQLPPAKVYSRTSQVFFKTAVLHNSQCTANIACCCFPKPPLSVHMLNTGDVQLNFGSKGWHSKECLSQSDNLTCPCFGNIVVSSASVFQEKVVISQGNTYSEKENQVEMISDISNVEISSRVLEFAGEISILNPSSC